jgi:ACS family glucarate transporter-like MFS transporter
MSCWRGLEVSKGTVRSCTCLSRRNIYLLLLCLLAIITYLDRVCISVAGPRMQAALHITPERWGLVGTVFLVGYSLFEIPTGHWGDTLGARRVLTRIVLWWSVFTALTGWVSSYPLLLGIRFLFGAGEAGAFPTASVAISNWFSPKTRGRAFGLMIMSSQLGGALSPLLVIPLQQAFGWRASFVVFGSLGVFWTAVWFWQFRDHPAGSGETRQREHASWKPILKNRNLWLIMLLAFGYVYTMGFYQIWFHTYLEKGRGFSEKALAWSALPYALGAAANLAGGFACDWLVRILGVKWSRRAVGMAGLGISAAGLIWTLFASGQATVIAGLSLTYVGITFQQPAVFTACLDIGGVRGGAVTGFMNSAGQLGAALSSAVFGYMVEAFHSYNAPLIPMAVLMGLGTLVWALVDVTAKSDSLVRELEV